MLKQISYLTLLLLSLLLVVQSCYKSNYYSGSDVQLRFSVDTLVFDTVFTSVGSATRILKVYNDIDQSIELSSVYLKGQENSKFRINIDGRTGPETSAIEIGPKDSIYIFGEVTVDPDEPISASPFIIEDHIVFEVNGNKQEILLEAWGQNANYLPSKSAKGKAFISTCDMGIQTWNDDKPYVIYGTLLIDSCTIVIPEGTQIYIHGGYVRSDSGQEYNDGQLYFLKNGSLQVEGSLENPVIFQTDRLEHKYDDISGLWSGLYFVEGSKNNSMKHAVLKNANIGMYLDSACQMSLSHVKILHNIHAGIYARHAELSVRNSLIADSGGYGLLLRYGGNYLLEHCTIANYDNQQEALYMGNYQCRNSLCTEIDVNPLNATLKNCIFYGNGDDELFFEDAIEEDPAFFQFNMENCLVAVDELLETDAFADFLDNCNNCINGAGEENLFVDQNAYDFRPDTLSVVIDAGAVIEHIPDDLAGNSRDQKPDIGCYEFF